MKKSFALASLLAALVWAQDTITNETIIRLKEAQMSEEFILNAIKHNNVSFTMSSGDLVKLKNADVSERIIETMFMRKLQAQGFKVEAPAAPPTQAAKVAAGGSAAPAAPTPAAPAAAPPKAEAKPPAPPHASEPGVMYQKAKDSWADVIPEAIAWSEKGMVKNIKHVASFTLLKKPVEGRVFGATSRTIVPSPSEIVVTVPSGASIHDFLLLQFEVHKGLRKVEVGPDSSDKKNAASKSIPYGVDKLDANRYKLVLPAGLRPGEYGVVNVKSIGKEGDGRIYTFRVIPST